MRYEDHVRYLESLNMEPEVDALGNWIGYDEKFELPRPEGASRRSSLVLDLRARSRPL